MIIRGSKPSFFTGFFTGYFAAEWVGVIGVKYYGVEGLGIKWFFWGRYYGVGCGDV